MAGGGHHETLYTDPALSKYNTVFQERYKFFRWTPRTTFLTLAYTVIFPGFIGYLSYKYEGKWHMRGKLRGDTVSEW